MSYDERAVAFTEKLERLIGRGDAVRRRCGAIRNALEYMVEEDMPAPDPIALQFLGKALVAQATLAGMDVKRVSLLVEELSAHVRAR